MNIQEAVKSAMEKEKCITLPEFEKSVKIKPTNTSKNCVLFIGNGECQSKHGWQPNADFLIRDDWIVVD